MVVRACKDPCRGEGLFVKESVEADTVLAFYNGVRLTIYTLCVIFEFTIYTLHLNYINYIFCWMLEISIYSVSYQYHKNLSSYAPIVYKDLKRCLCKKNTEIFVLHDSRGCAF